MTNRRTFLFGVAALASSPRLVAGNRAAPANDDRHPAAGGPAPFDLAIQPTRVFKRTGDRNRLRLDHWAFVLVLRSAPPGKPAPGALVVDALAGGTVLRTTRMPAAALAATDLLPPPPAATDGAPRPVAAYSLADTAPAALGVDALRITLAHGDAGGTAVLTVPLETYVQKTPLRFPFAGPGLITQGGAWNDGHRNRSGLFAVDAIGLTAAYAAMVGDGDARSAVAGWGRELVAPAAGTVVVAVGDRPDQPVTGVSDPAYFAPAFPQGGDPGNHVVIDPGGGEFSVIAHLRQGSLRVAVGERVAAGQALGALGNSGDSDTPHVHHQLQSGPDWTTADALPHVYTNGPGERHDRGTFFDAR